PLVKAPAGKRWFRQTFEVKTAAQQNPVDEAILEITADDRFTVWVNGTEAGKGNDWRRVYRFDLAKHLIKGQNVLAVEPTTDSESPAGLMVKLAYLPNGQIRSLLVSDGTWKTSKTETKGWRGLDFDDKGWKTARVLGPFGEVGPWHKVAAGKKPRQ